MNSSLAAAAEALLDILRSENAALARLDLAGAAALGSAKERAAQAFTAALGDRAGLQAELGTRLVQEAARNRALLERGMDVQGRILAIVAGAARAAVAGAAGYGAGGRRAERGAPVAFSWRT
ncbi:MAG TPA: hypothetical protein VFA03_00515 [Acetobacteraceae bacterium]|nr:hypothetical protein [Acetobacteraceae bacterium]